MKRIILIISFIITLLGISITASPYLLRMLGLDKPFKRYLVSKIIDDKKSSIDIQNFNIGLGKLELTDFSLASKDEQFKLMVNLIEFEFNFWDLFLNPAQPQNALSAIKLIKPRLILQKIKNNNSPENITDDSSPEQYNMLFEKVSKLQSIKEIQIRDGRIIWKKGSGEYVALAQNLYGWINTKDFTDISLDAEGTIFSAANENFKLTSNINLFEKQFKAVVKLVKYEVNNSALPYFTKEVRVDKGTLNGEIVFENNGFKIDSTNINGKVSVKNLDLSVDNNKLNNVGLEIDINDNHLLVSNVGGNYFDTPFLLNAEINNVFKPQIFGQLISKGLPAQHLERYLSTNLFNSSKINLITEFELTENDPKIKAIIQAEVLHIKEKGYLKNLLAKLTWTPQQFMINHISADYQDIAIKGFGGYNPSDNNLNISLSGQHKSGKHIIFDRLSDKTQKLALSIAVNTSNKVTQGKWFYSIAGESDTLLVMNGSIYGSSDQLNVNLLNSNFPDMQASIKIKDLMGKVLITNAHLINFPISAFASEPFVHNSLDRFYTDISLSGYLNNLSGGIKVIDKYNSNNDFKLNASILNLLSAYKQIKGGIELKGLFGFYEFDLSNDFFGGTFNFPDGIDGELYIDFTKEEHLSGIINFSDFNIMQAFTDSSLTDDFHLLGNVNGKVNISGDIPNPIFKAHLYGDKFVLNDVGYYQAELILNADRTKINVDSLTISLNNTPILEGELGFSFVDNNITGFFTGEEIDVERILTTVSNKNKFLTGTGSYLMKLTGSVDSPRINALVDIKNGVLDDIAFDDFQFSIRDSVSHDGKIYNFEDHIISLENLSFVKKGHFNLSGTGILPFNSSDQIDMLVKFNGDIFSLLPHWQSFFLDGASLADITVKLSGTYDDVSIESGNIEIERGELWLKNVASHIENIHGKIELKKGSNKVNIINLKCGVNDETLTINTIRDVITTEGDRLKHWYFKGIDLDFGILKLETSSEGVELNIPGLMAKEESGNLHLSGKDEEYFYFAGPVKHPVARGVLTLYNATLTYPFITNKKPNAKPSKAVRFLKNMEWDVLLKSGEDVMYVREIPAYIDKVNTEIFVDESSQGLNFKGIINEKTFRPVGELTASRGRLEYLDQNFKVDRFVIEFSEYDILPRVSGQAWTTIRDSVGAVPKTIYLQLYIIDEETGLERQQGSWENFKFKLVSADPQLGETQEQVLAYLGFSVTNIKEKATSVGGAMTEKYLIRPLLRPIERAVERGLGLDLFRINSNIAKNIFCSSLSIQDKYVNNGLNIDPFNTDTPYLFLMQSSEVTVGKYLTQNLYLTYTGQLVSVYNQSQTEFDFNHSFGIEYRFLRNILLEFEYDRELMGMYKFHNQKQYLEDFKIRLRHSFTF